MNNEFNIDLWISKLNKREVSFLLYLFQQNYPKLIIDNRIKNSHNINNLLKKFKKSLLIHIVISSVFIFLIIKPLLLWQDKVEFEKYLPLIYFFYLRRYSLTQGD